MSRDQINVFKCFYEWIQWNNFNYQIDNQYTEDEDQLNKNLSLLDQYLALVMNDTQIVACGGMLYF